VGKNKKIERFDKNNSKGNFYCYFVKFTKSM